jgi:hypothetical protein
MLQYHSCRKSLFEDAAELQSQQGRNIIYPQNGVQIPIEGGRDPKDKIKIAQLVIDSELANDLNQSFDGIADPENIAGELLHLSSDGSRQRSTKSSCLELYSINRSGNSAALTSSLESKTACSRSLSRTAMALFPVAGKPAIATSIRYFREK